MTLITTTDELKTANSAVVHDLNFESVQSFVEDASIRDLIPAIGRTTYVLIGVGGDASGLAIAAQLAKKCEANLAIAYYVNFGSVKLSENGAQVYQDGNNRIASDRKITALCNQSRLDGYRSLDALLEYLETDRETFTAYHESLERKARLNGFLNTTADFNEALYINENPLLFRSLRSYIRDAETEHIIPILGDEYAETLKANILARNCSDVEKLLQRHIAKAVAQFAIAEAIPYRAISFDANGIFTNTVGASADGGNVEKQAAGETKRLTMAMSTALAAGNKHLDRLRKFISKNKDALTGINEVKLNTRSTLNDEPRGFFFA